MKASTRTRCQAMRYEDSRTSINKIDYGSSTVQTHSLIFTRPAIVTREIRFSE
jgi:hypothetical protein